MASPPRTVSRDGRVGDASVPSVAETKRDLERAQRALAEPGAGALGTLECQVGVLQERLIATPARDAADFVARLQVIRDLVAGLGPRGYLLDLVDATLTDARRLGEQRTTDEGR